MNQKVWFTRWITEGYSVRQLVLQSGLSYKKITQIKAYWLTQSPPPLTPSFTQYKYLIFDATYFNHERCVMVLQDSSTHTVIAAHYALNESYVSTIDWLGDLCAQGLHPCAVTMDGQLKVIRAISEVWPQCLIQRCTYHIQRQGEMWLRRYPRTSLAKDLKDILHQLPFIRAKEGQVQWHTSFMQWKEHYSTDIVLLSSKDKVEADIIRAYRVIEHAYPHMFLYLQDNAICSTSNALEGYFSHLKRLYRNHAGIRKAHLNQYLAWYIYLKNL